MRNKDNHNTNILPKANKIDKNELKMRNQAEIQNNLNPFICHQKINNFHFSRYPFQNDDLIEHQFIKTTVSCQIDQSRLRKLMRITHPHLINIMKIVKGYPKQFSNPRLSGYYSFFYEQVPYSLKRVAAITECQGTMMKSIKKIKFYQILQELTEYLYSLEIYHIIKLDDIGLDSRFQIKVYVPPTAFLQDNEQNKDKRSVLKNNQKIISWWKTTFQCNDEPPIKISSLDFIRVPGQYRESLFVSPQKIKSNKSSFIAGQSSQIIMQNEEEQQENIQKMKISHSQQKLTNLICSNQFNQKNLSSSIKEDNPRGIINKQARNTLKYSNRSFKTELTASKNLQNNQKIQKIHAEVLRLKQKIHKASFEYHLRKQSGNGYLQKIHGLNASTNNKFIFQSAKFQKKQKPPQQNKHQPSTRYHQPIQQNINCINIYNNNSQPKRNQAITNQPVLSYNITPKQNTKIKPKCKPMMISYPNLLIPDDSYDSMNDNFQEGEALVHDSLFRHSLQPNQHHPNISNFRSIDKPKIINKNHIPVGSKNVTESAGPLQFKNIINNLIKPQFLSKKSNIYEEMHEDQSEHSLKKQSSKAQNTTNAQNQKDSNHPTINESEVKHWINHQQKHQKSNQKNKYNKIRPFDKQIDYRCCQKYLPYQKSYVTLDKSPKYSDNALSAKVREVLAKTKNAINLLNRVKSSNSINRKHLSP